MKELLLLVVCASILSCTDLADIPGEGCGNGVVDAGEDCDSFGTTACVSCRWACSSSENVACPNDFLCGADNVCRKPTGEYEAVRVPALAYELLTGKFSGTARDEIWSRGPTSAVHSFDATRRVLQTLSVPGSTTGFTRQGAAVLNINGDAFADAVMANPDGNLDILLGNSQRGLIPDSFAARKELPAGRLFSAVASRVNRPDLVLYAGNTLYVRYDVIDDFSARYELELTAEGTAERIGVGNINDSIEDELAIAKVGDSRVLIANLSPDGETPMKATTLSWVTLPPEMEINWGAAFGEIDGNQHRDLIVGAQRKHDTEQVVLVAYGVGDGTFHSASDTLPPKAGDGKFWPVPIATERSSLQDQQMGAPNEPNRVIAIGNLNGDSVSDFVLQGGEFLLSGQRPFGDYDTCSVETVTRWKCQQGIALLDQKLQFAAIGDFNGNGFPDVIALRTPHDGFDFFNGTGKELFNLSVVAFDGLVQSTPLPVIGDFDGDLNTDLAFTYRNVSSQDSQLAILFGEHGTTPKQIVQLGGTGENPQLTVGHTNFNVQDNVSDLLAMWKDGGALRFATFDGRQDRHPYSPFTLTSKGPGGAVVRNAVQAVVGGKFSAKSLDDVAAVTQQWTKEDVSIVHLLSPSEKVDSAFKVLPEYIIYGTDRESEPSGVSLHNVDIDRDGRDEFVIFGYPKPNEISLMRFNADGWTLDPPIQVPNATNLRTLAVDGDFDQDGYPDVLLRNVRDAVAEFVLFRTGASGSLNFTTPKYIPFTQGVALAMRTLNANADTAPELVIATLHKGASPPHSLTFMSIDPETFTLQPLNVNKLPFALPLQSSIEPSASDVLELELGLGLTTGDFDGNGLDDVAVGGVELGVFFAKSTHDSETAP
jgi:hypothetical protein